MPSPSDPVTLVVGSTSINGWEEVRVTLRCEGLPNDFEVTFAQIDPLTGQQTVAQANDAVQVYLGADLVITGYVDDDGNDSGPSSHQLTLAGRGRTRDLVDCSAQWSCGLINGVDMVSLCNKLGQPYGITAALADGTSLPPGCIPTLALNYGETCAEIIGRVARNQRMLYYEGPDGNLVISQVGSAKAASGVGYGQNVQRWSVNNSMAQRYSKIICAQFSTSPVYDVGDGTFNLFGEVDDTNVKLPRTLIINTEGLSATIAKAKAQWELARRAGRGTVVRATVDSWRDAAGTLWTPNTLVNCQGPGLRWRPQNDRGQGPVNLVLSEVTFRYSGDGGTLADLVLMPPDAFSPEPVQLVPPVQDVSPSGGRPPPPQF